MNKKITAIVAIIVLAIITYFTSPWWTHNSEEVTVNSVMVKAASVDSDPKYLVFTDKGVFENTDTWYYFKFNSSDVQARVVKPGKYRINYYGWRVPFFSKYPNITSVQ